MFFLRKKTHIKGGDTKIESYFIYHQLSGVKDCSHERLKISHTVY